MAKFDGNVSDKQLSVPLDIIEISFEFDFIVLRWALKHGNPILSSAVVISSAVILNFYRTKLKLRNYGRFTLFLPVVLVPSIFNQIYQSSVCIPTQLITLQTH